MGTFVTARKTFCFEICEAGKEGEKEMQEYLWEVQVMEEVDPIYVTTESDSVLEAAQKFEDCWGSLSVRYLRKKAVTKKIQYENFFEEDWQVAK